jgi:hypothetical protein
MISFFLESHTTHYTNTPKGHAIYYSIIHDKTPQIIHPDTNYTSTLTNTARNTKNTVVSKKHIGRVFKNRHCPSMFHIFKKYTCK